MGHPGQDDRAGDPEAAGRVVLPVVPGASPPGRAALAAVVATWYLLGVVGAVLAEPAMNGPNAAASWDWESSPPAERPPSLMRESITLVRLD